MKQVQWGIIGDAMYAVPKAEQWVRKIGEGGGRLVKGGGAGIISQVY
jgi:hypothetical protein